MRKAQIEQRCQRAELERARALRPRARHSAAVSVVKARELKEDL
jgi:hypothetical protein